jgi:hypothetical protein
MRVVGREADSAGISLRELIHEFKWQTLVLFKCALLQPKVCTPSRQGAQSERLTHSRSCSSAPIVNDYA